jgi:hypothetical protein
MLALRYARPHVSGVFASSIASRRRIRRTIWSQHLAVGVFDMR